MSCSGRRAAVGVAAALVALTGLVSSASPAPAVFPGQNGPLAGGGCEPMNVYDCGLYLQTAAGTRRILKTGKLFVKEAQWSPDGKRIAYVIGSSTGTELRVVGADGRGDRLVLKETGELYIGFSSTDWSWMRDSRHIAFVSTHTFLKIDANATNTYSSLTTPLRGMYATEVDASPVSDLLAVVYFNTEAQERGIALIALDDNGSNLGIREFKRVRALPWDADDNYASIGWAPDGRRLAFVHSIVDKSIGKGTARVEVVAALPDAPTPTPLTEYPKGTRDGAAYVEIARYSPDGKWIAFKTIRDMTATWEAIHPDGTERSPFAARLGEIDWQPCSSNCETLNPGKSQPPEECASKQKLAVVLTANGGTNAVRTLPGGKCWSFTTARTLPSANTKPEREKLFPGSTVPGRGFNGCDLSRDNKLWLWDEVNEYSSKNPKELSTWLATCKRVTGASAGALYYNYASWQFPSPFSPAPSLGVKYKFAELYRSETVVKPGAIPLWSSTVAKRGFSGVINIGDGTDASVRNALRDLCARTRPPLALGLWHSSKPVVVAVVGARADMIKQTLDECTKKAASR